VEKAFGGGKHENDRDSCLQQVRRAFASEGGE